MDPVSRILIEREGRHARLTPFAIIALVMHIGIAFGIFFMARGAASKPAHLPVVAVKLIRAQPKIAPTRPKASSETETTQPKPSAPPKIAPTAVPTRKPVKTTPPVETTKTASKDAMQSIDATPQPTQKPKPAAGGTGGGTTHGVSLGSGDSNSRGGAPPGVPSDFQFTYYINRMLTLIESHWYKPPVSPKTKAQVGFRILKSGRIEAVRLEESSGVPTFDRAVLRALYASNPLPPLPPAYQRPSLTIHLTFSE